jgi:formate hydrogenlyase subunit 3/multisubunit Na+/H+ antiporter MnhD subunit
MKIFEWLTSFIAWLQIVAFPLLIGVAAGFLIYINYPSTAGILTGISIVVLGLVARIILATRIWKKRGSVDFVSSIAATPELDNLDQEKEQ